MKVHKPTWQLVISSLWQWCPSLQLLLYCCSHFWTSEVLLQPFSKQIFFVLLPEKENKKLKIKQLATYKCTWKFEKGETSQDAFLVSLDIDTLYTNIPQEERINTVCKAYQTFHRENTLSPPNPSEESINLFFKRTHLNSTAKTISKHTELQWVQRWQSPLPTSLCRWSR